MQRYSEGCEKMPIEIRQLNIRTSIVDPPSRIEDVPPLDQRSLEQFKHEVMSELKQWLDARRREQRGR